MINNILYDQKDFKILKCKHIIHVVDKTNNEDYWTATLEATTPDNKNWCIFPENLTNKCKYDINWQSLKYILKCAGFRTLRRYDLECDFYTRTGKSAVRTYYKFKLPELSIPQT